MSFWNWLTGNNKNTGPTKKTGRNPQLTSPSSKARVKWRANSYPMEVVGESNYQESLSAICGGHSRVGHDLETEALLVAEPSNPFDENATAVEIHGQKVGYLARAQAKRVSSQMQEAGISKAVCSAKVIGGWRTNQHDEGSFGVRLAIPVQGQVDFGLNTKKTGTSNIEVTAPETKGKRPKPAVDGPLKGESVKIWGATDCGPEAEELAALGAKIMTTMGKTTTLVVQVDDELTPGMARSATYLKAQERIAEGAKLRIVTLAALRSQIDEMKRQTQDQ